MLYDPKWEVQTRPDALTIKGVISWLEKQNPNEPYNYMNCAGRCLYGQYMAHHGYSWNEADKAPARSAITSFQMEVYCKVAAAAPFTFGAALKRARKALA